MNPQIDRDRTFAVAEPKSQRTYAPDSDFKMFSTLRSLWIIGVWQW